jgi:hypothetical protein
VPQAQQLVLLVGRLVLAAEHWRQSHQDGDQGEDRSSRVTVIVAAPR